MEPDAITPQVILLTREGAEALNEGLRALGVSSYVHVSEKVNPANQSQFLLDESGKPKKFYRVEATLDDPRHGNMAVRRILVPSDPAILAREMKAEIKDRAKSTRTRIRTERDLDRS